MGPLGTSANAAISKDDNHTQPQKFIPADQTQNHIHLLSIYIIIYKIECFHILLSSVIILLVRILITILIHFVSFNICTIFLFFFISYTRPSMFSTINHLKISLIIIYQHKDNTCVNLKSSIDTKST